MPDPLSTLHQDPAAVPRAQDRYRYRIAPTRYLGTPLRVILRWLEKTRRWLVLGPAGETSIHEEDPRSRP